MKPFKGWNGVTTPPKEAARLLAVATAALPGLTAYGVTGAQAESEGAFEHTPEIRTAHRADIGSSSICDGRHCSHASNSTGSGRTRHGPAY
jgi:hypothetical protein